MNGQHAGYNQLTLQDAFLLTLAVPPSDQSDNGAATPHSIERAGGPTISFTANNVTEILPFLDFSF